MRWARPLAVRSPPTRNAAAHTTLAVHELFTNQHDEAVRRLHRAIEFDPNSSFARGWHTCGAWAHLHAEHFAEAVESAKQAIDVNPSFPDSHATLTEAAAHRGRMTEAHAGIDGFVRLLPGLSITDPRLIRPFRRQVDRERFLDSLRKAGLPE